MKKVELHDSDLHPHLKARMEQRGISTAEIQKTLKDGWEADDAKPGTSGKIHVFPYNDYWEEQYFQEKEVKVYFKFIENELILLTVLARDGETFPKKSSK